MSTQPMRDRTTAYISNLQETIVAALQALDPAAPPFKRDAWDREQGGRGIARTFSASGSESTVLEKAGVNISMIHGSLSPASIKQMSTAHSSVPYAPGSTESLPFFAAGISLVVHPRHPDAPTVHANYRYFEITEPPTTESSEEKTVAWWFGGITDLTPNYLFEEDVVHFHQTLKNACDSHGNGQLYPAFKKSCDDYFYLPHRGEHRGVGGIRFDDLCDEKHELLGDDVDPRPRSADEIFDFVKTLADAFLPSYIPIITRRTPLVSQPDDDEATVARKRRWQLLRRGRYVEFNLIYDRGTKFGLATPGVRIENVLMSLPETARWEYMSEMGTEAGTEEAKMLDALETSRTWVVKA